LLGLKISDIIRDEKLLKYARGEASQLLKQDPHLQHPTNQPIVKKLQSLREFQTDWSRIS
jgi:ATP-dependent DNA helicase RecG